ncbi:MAG TPA: Ig-like domain-containing protein [Geobacteraceae bacterium]
MFGPKRYDRLKGAPTVYTDTFVGCSQSSGQALLRVTNGSGKATSVTAGNISVNGTVVVAENDFKQQTYLIEKPITVREVNQLRVELKSGGPQIPFVIIEIIGGNCDSLPPVISGPSPADGALLNNPRPVISAVYGDEATGSGINTGSVRLAVDNIDVTAAASVAVTGISYTPAAPLPDGLHTVSLSVADRAANSATLVWRFTTDTAPPTVTITAPADGFLTKNAQVTVTGQLSEDLTTVTVNDVPAAVTGKSFTLAYTLAEGANILTVRATDRAGNAGSAAVTGTVDSIPPSAPLYAPLPSPTRTGSVTLSGTTEDHAAVKVLAGTILIGTVAADAQGGFNLPGVALTEGANSFTAIAIDQAGNESAPSLPLNIVLDTQPPQLVVSTLADGSYTNNATINITGTAQDNVGLHDLRVKGTVVPVNADGSYSYALLLQNGENQVQVTAQDLAGNSTSDNRKVILDQKAPVITIDSPADNSKTRNPAIQVSGSVDKQAAVQVKVKDTVFPTEMDGLKFTATVTPEYGTNTIEVSAVDLAGNPAAEKRTVLFDDQKPSLAITDPNQDIRTNRSSLTLKGTAGDELTAVKVTVSKEGETFTPPVINGTFEQEVGFTEEKSYAITVTATDEVGNTVTAQRNIIYDITPPAVAIDPVTSPTNQASQVISGTREADAKIAVSSATATVSDISYPTATTWKATASVFTADSNDIVATATDAAGNSATATATIVYDITAPTGTIIIDNGTNVTGTTQVQLGLSSTDASGVTQMRFSSDGSAWSDPTTYVSTMPWALLTGDGTKQVFVQFMDLAGNWSNPSNAGIVLDTTPPAVTATPAGGLYRTAQAVTLMANEAATIYYTTDGSTPTDASAVYSQQIAIPATATLSFFAKDAAGNKSQPRSESYTIDTVPPTVTITAPVPGLLTRTSRVTVSGSLSEENCTVTVNGTAAAVTGKSFAVDYTLSEGLNTLTAFANDAAGNPGSATVTATLDSTPPAQPVITPLKTPTNVAAVTINGTTEAGATVKILMGPALLGTVIADAQGKFTLPGITLGEGSNTFTATAADPAGNESLPSLPVTAVLDTKPPVITVTAPADKSYTNNPQLVVKGALDDATAVLTVNGVQAALNSTDFEQGVTLAQGLNTVTLSATDPAGNTAIKTVTITLDTIPPAVTITSPVSGSLTNNPRVTVAGGISEADTTATIGDVPITVTNQAFSAAYTLAEGDNTITVKALDKAGNPGSAAVTVTLDTQAPQLSLNAPAEATAGANITIGVSAADNRGLTLVELKADGVPIWSGGSAPSLSESVSYKLSTSLNAGSTVLLQARGLDAAGNEGTATASINISQAAMGPGYIQGKVLDDGRGLLLSDAEVTVTDSKGSATVFTTASDGGYFTETAAGSTLVKVAKEGFTAVERLVPVMPENKATALDARLTPVSAQQNLIDSTGGVLRMDVGAGSPRPAVELTVPAGALSAQADIRLTPVSNQGLAGVLPAGWSPVAAADLRLLDPAAGTPLDATFSSAATFKTPLPASIAAQGDPPPTLTVAAYDATSHQWIAKGNATVAADVSSATFALQGAGQYAFLVPDPAPGAPPAPQAGTPLLPATAAALNYDATTAAGKVVPQAAPPSVGLKAAGEVVLTAKDGADPAPQFASGLVLNSRITESFNLNSGDKVEPSVYAQDIILYRAPCITNIGGGVLTDVPGAALRATFPVSPSRDFTIVDLLLGKVGIEIVKPDLTDSGVMVGTDGGRIVDADGNVLAVPAGALSLATPVSTKNGTAATGAVGSDFTLLKAVEVNLTRQTLAASATLSIPLPAGVDPTLPLLVAKGVDVKGVTKLKLVAMARLSGSFINSDLTAAGITLPGITTSGTYYFLQSKTAIGFVSGTVADSSNAPFTGALVKTDTGSLIDLSASTGKYLLAAPAAPFTATALDLYKGDQGTATGAITAPNQAVALDLAIRMVPPQVLSVSPAANEANVQPSVPVVVSFTKGMDRTSINATTLKVTDSTGSAVSGVISFNVDGTAATFYPAAAFQSEASYSITVAGTVKDLQGYPLGQDVTSGFTVRKTTPPPMPAAGAVSGTFPDADGFITVTGTQGSADPKDTVLIINDTTGEIASVAPASNGSFTGKVKGQLGDQIKVMLMDYSGNQTLISYLTFKGPDGSYLVTAKGGKIEGEGGSILEIPEGALYGPTVIKMTVITEASLPHPVQEGASFVAGVNLDTGGVPFQKEVQFSVPLPTGYDNDKTPFVAKPDTLVNADGTVEKVFVIVDSAKVVDGRLSTACEPFGGVMTPGILAFFQFPYLSPAIVSGYAYRDMDGDGTYSPGDLPIKNAVIRAPGAWNYVSYANSSGFYATFSSIMVNIGMACQKYSVTAINPQTMYRKTIDTVLCEPPYNIKRLNFKLADKDSVFPDKTAPVVSFNLQVASGQPPEAKFTAGTVPVGTDIEMPLSVIDQSMGTVTLTVQAPGAEAPQPVQVNQDGYSIHSVLSADQPAIFRYSYSLVLSAPVVGSMPGYFRPALPGVYTFVVEAKDAAGNITRVQKQIRAVDPGSTPGGIDGPPTVDKMSPATGAQEVPVNAAVVVYFSEPVDNITDDTCKLIDTVTGLTVPARIIAGIENGRMKVELAPKGNLVFGRKYQVTLTQGISDSNPNPSAGNAVMALKEPVTTTFITKALKAFDLPISDQRPGGRDIAIYTDADTESVHTYVTANDQGWNGFDVSDSTNPLLTYKQPPLNQFSFRYAAVEPQLRVVGITDSVFGLKYGYVRFYDLGSPDAPVKIGQERLSEEYSGVPSRLAMSGKYAYVANLMVGLQVVDVDIAKENISSGSMSSGKAIVGVVDTIGENNSQPWDIALYGTGRGLLTTSKGYLLSLDLSTPEAPQIMTTFHPAGYSATRAAAVAGYAYTAADDSSQTMDLAVTGGAIGTVGKINTVDVSDPYNPHVIGTVKDAYGFELSSIPSEIAISKEAGLAFVATFNSVQIIDIKDPYNPKLLNEVNQLPTDGAGIVQLVGNYGIVEKDGSLYLANDQQGLKVIQFVSRPIDILPIKATEIDDAGHSMDDIVISYRVNNPDFAILSGEVNIYKNGTKILTLPSGTQHLASVTIPKGQAFDVNAKYQAEVVLNGDTADPLISYKARIPVYNVKVTIDNIDNLITKQGISLNDLKVTYTIQPTTYHASNANVILLEDGTQISSVVGGTAGSNTIKFPKGIHIKNNSTYEVYVDINYGLYGEKKSDKKVVKLTNAEKLVLRDATNQCNIVPLSKEDKVDKMQLMVAANASDYAMVQLHVTPESSGAMTEKRIVWKITSPSGFANPPYGDMSSVDPVISVTPSNDAYVVTVAVDENENGIVDSNETIINTFRVKVFSKSEYDNYFTVLEAMTWLGSKTHKVAGSLLYNFIGKPGSAPIVPADVINYDPMLSSYNYYLSHATGAEFNSDSCKANIKQYIYKDSVSSNTVVNSRAVATFINNEINSIVSEVRSRNLSDTNLTETFSLSNVKDYDFCTNDGMDEKSPECLAFGKADIDISFKANVAVDVDGRICVTSINAVGTLNDLYDFSYYDGGFSVPAAVLQIGWNAKLNGGNQDKGAVFWNTILIDIQNNYGNWCF